MTPMSLGTAAAAFAAGFISVLVFHQGVWALYGAAGKAPSPAWNMAPVPPLGVPTVLSSSFWGGLWGIVLAWLLPLAAPSMGYWPAAIILGALLTSLVALMVVAPLKGRPFAGGWSRGCGRSRSASTRPGVSARACSCPSSSGSRGERGRLCCWAIDRWHGDAGAGGAPELTFLLAPLRRSR